MGVPTILLFYVGLCRGAHCAPVRMPKTFWDVEDAVPYNSAMKQNELFLILAAVEQIILDLDNILSDI